jgi:hypothetical protein
MAMPASGILRLSGCSQSCGSIPILQLCTDESESCRIGMIAQEVEKIIPSIVSCEETKGIAYGKLVAVLVEGMKEQQRQIDDLKKDLNYFRNYNP